jgi:hypothetical protein
MLGIRRNIKKALYAGLFAGAALLIGMGILYGSFESLSQLWLQANEPVPLQYEPISIERVDTILHEDTLDVTAQVRNPNPRVGLPEYTITFVLQAKDGTILEQLSRQTYILPGSLTYITIIGIPRSAEVSQVAVSVPPETKFVPLPEHVSLPSFNTFVKERNIRTIGQRKLEEIKGVIINTSTLGFKHVEITGVALDNASQVVSVGTTFVGELQIGQQREFTLQWPLSEKTGERIIILPSTNIYREDNILPIVGDPNLLR